MLLIRGGELVLLRREVARLSAAGVVGLRDGSGDHVRFDATDFLGRRREDGVLVCLPHDQRFGAGCGDGGPLYSSIP
jgi:hypothetical protein